VATGGLSVPDTGSDGLGLRIVEGLGHAVHPTYAALTPLTAEPAPFGTLAGVSLPVTLSARAGGRKATATGGFLFTHRGYSGPAVLDVSHVAVRSRADAGSRLAAGLQADVGSQADARLRGGAGSSAQAGPRGGEAPARLLVRWTRLGDAEWEAALRPVGTRTAVAALRAELPERLAFALLEAARVDPARGLADLRRDERLRLIETLVRGVLPWTGDEGYKKAEVTGGGVSLAEIDPRTMESRRHPGLFLCGELLDAFGPIGGYNFLWAWATGRAAGLGAAGLGVAMPGAAPASRRRRST